MAPWICHFNLNWCSASPIDYWFPIIFSCYLCLKLREGPSRKKGKPRREVREVILIPLVHQVLRFPHHVAKVRVTRKCSLILARVSDWDFVLPASFIPSDDGVTTSHTVSGFCSFFKSPVFSFATYNVCLDLRSLPFSAKSLAPLFISIDNTSARAPEPVPASLFNPSTSSEQGTNCLLIYSKFLFSLLTNIFLLMIF